MLPDVLLKIVAKLFKVVYTSGWITFAASPNIIKRRTESGNQMVDIVLPCAIMIAREHQMWITTLVDNHPSCKVRGDKTLKLHRFVGIFMFDVFANFRQEFLEGFLFIRLDFHNDCQRVLQHFPPYVVEMRCCFDYS